MITQQIGSRDFDFINLIIFKQRVLTNIYLMIECLIITIFITIKLYSDRPFIVKLS